jgi:hypothetical protein
LARVCFASFGDEEHEKDIKAFFGNLMLSICLIKCAVSPGEKRALQRQATPFAHDL